MPSESVGHYRLLAGWLPSVGEVKPLEVKPLPAPDDTNRSKESVFLPTSSGMGRSEF